MVKAVSKAKRLMIYARDGERCLICMALDNLTLDHIVPVSIGGCNRPFNLQTLCESCNRQKGNKVICLVRNRQSVAYVNWYFAGKLIRDFPIKKQTRNKHCAIPQQPATFRMPLKDALQ